MVVIQRTCGVTLCRALATREYKRCSVSALTFWNSVDAGLTFAGVHDSFWTHARDVDEMSAILRDKFIEVHNEPLLDNLYQELRATYPDVADDFPPPPAPGDLSLDVVKESVYFFS